ncbi:hypothetical protein MGYG_00630 [Nannizzia gypsea CBS 118893]|uniref:Prolyl 4-hydroxylase alpha subunit domain-containing protein n=1 Tax=Arthroderma gypseum (strain ATCC MYA-4604 / CBS 118893) TaxID=535722 RepID=E5R0T5_ARTGP|nr:hypothetical protein MGYG_00630 [Nannizzia gypsea CBS 118893]EFQ97591.1 hypothetical protein MGYG_00630 [Nannizzia gypsea CBS 118893]
MPKKAAKETVKVTSKVAAKSKEESPAQKTPNWPALRPLPPTSDLCLTPILPAQIYIIRNLFSSALCKTYVSFLASLPLITTPGRPKKNEALRVNDRFQVEDASFAELLWSGTGLKELICSTSSAGQSEDEKVDWDGEVLGLNPNIRVYRYTKGQFFGQHYDESVQVMHGTPPVKGRTSWTLLIYLSTCSGGETAFYPEPEPELGSRKGKAQQRQPEPVVVGMETGMALLHRHGDECLLHEGREVMEGEKWVIRSDLVVKR